MNILEKITLKLSIEKIFFLEQRMGWKTPADQYNIPKFLLRKFLPADPVIIDCGACDGTDSIELARIFPHASIHSFEPVPQVFNALTRNTRKYRNVHCYQMALSNATGKANMHISSGASYGSSSLLAPKTHLNDHPTVFFENTIEVNTITLDDWADSQHLSRVDFLWLDMQGFEYEMLRASNRIIDTIKAIHTEVSVKETYEQVKLYPAFRQWAEEKGFRVFREAVPDGTDMGNVLFVRG
jgi:FkbM family methyltransferase